MRKSSKLLLAIVVVLALFACLIWYAALAEDRRGLLTVSFLNVGQGDAVFIDAPSGRQVLIDGGPGASVLRELASVSPWYDRSIDIVVATHPDLDHIGGLLDVLPRYRVATIVLSSVQGETSAAAKLMEDARRETADVRIAERGDVYELGKGARLEILFPDREVPGVATNQGCIVARLTYGSRSFMLPCDTDKNIEQYLTRLDGEQLKSDVLKAAHHGSKTSSLPLFVGYVSPAYAVFSRGCDNSYGHPHKEVVDTFATFSIPTLDTCEEGTITFVSDGQTVWRR